MAVFLRVLIRVKHGSSFSQLLTTGTKRDFRAAGVASLPLIRVTTWLCMLSIDSGLFYSYSGSAGWEQPDQIKGGTVKAVAVDPKSKCTIYIVIGNMIYQSAIATAPMARFTKRRGRKWQ